MDCLKCLDYNHTVIRSHCAVPVGSPFLVLGAKKGKYLGTAHSPGVLYLLHLYKLRRSRKLLPIPELGRVDLQGQRVGVSLLPLADVFASDLALLLAAT